MSKFFFELAVRDPAEAAAVERVVRALSDLAPGLVFRGQDWETPAFQRRDDGSGPPYFKRWAQKRRRGRDTLRSIAVKGIEEHIVTRLRDEWEEAHKRDDNPRPPAINHYDQRALSEAERALHELEELASRSSSRHRTLFRIHMTMAIVLMAAATAFAGWTAYLVQAQSLDYRVAFGAGGAGATAIFWRRFEPFDKARDAMRFLERSDHAMVIIRMQMASIATITDVKERETAVATALRHLLDRL